MSLLGTQLIHERHNKTDPFRAVLSGWPTSRVALTGDVPACTVLGEVAPSCDGTTGAASAASFASAVTCPTLTSAASGSDSSAATATSGSD